MTTEPENDVDSSHMKKALREARKTLPSPNPPVGAVVVDREGAVVSAAHHHKAGEAHAEDLAVQAAGEAARGGTLYVTLEPCNHEGRTPRCVDAILNSGLSRVVIACRDPNPNVEGGGVERLTEAGIEVSVGVMAAEGRTLIAPWAKYITTGLPYVSLKLALSLDGRIATRSGASKWVTGPDARAKVHHIRAERDAVAVGIGTALSDDPLLTVRDAALSEGRRPPVRIVLDSSLRLPLHSRLAQTAKEAPVWILTGGEPDEDAEKALSDVGCKVIRVPNSVEGRVDVAAALKLLGQQGIVSILVEGGAELAGSLLASRFADELHAFIAPILLGPRGRPGAVDWAGPDTPGDAPRIIDPTWELCGRDAYVRGPLAFPQRQGG